MRSVCKKRSSSRIAQVYNLPFGVGDFDRPVIYGLVVLFDGQTVASGHQSSCLDTSGADRLSVQQDLGVRSVGFDREVGVEGLQDKPLLDPGGVRNVDRVVERCVERGLDAATVSPDREIQQQMSVLNGVKGTVDENDGVFGLDVEQHPLFLLLKLLV